MRNRTVFWFCLGVSLASAVALFYFHDQRQAGAVFLALASGFAGAAVGMHLVDEP